MNIKELNIGNFVLLKCKNEKDEIVKLLSLDDINGCFYNRVKNKKFINKKYDGQTNSWCRFEIINPITLTNKWLIDFGFIKDMDGNFVINNETLSITKDKKTDIYYACFDNIIIRKIENVNELQNLYFFITQKELIFKR